MSAEAEILRDSIADILEKVSECDEQGGWTFAGLAGYVTALCNVALERASGESGSETE